MGNDQALIELIDKLDPAQVANVITLVEALLAESRAELERITLASTNADAAYSDAENAHNTAGMNKINGEAAAKLDLDNGIADLQATHDAIVTALQGDPDNALSVKESALLAKQEANSVLNQEQNRLNHEISGLTHVIELLRGITTDQLPTSSPTSDQLPTSCRDVNGGSGVYNIDTDGSDGPKDPVEVYCEMSIDGGGWTVIGYLRNSAQWDYGIYDDNGVVGDVDGGFSTGSTMRNNVNLSGILYNQKLIVYLHLVENGVDLGTQWMVNSRNNALPFSKITEAGGWSYSDSLGYSYTSAGNVCTHGCITYRGFGMFRSHPFAGTQSEDKGCRDGNNICWQQRSLGCNVGSARCSLLTGPGEGVIYAVRNTL